MPCRLVLPSSSTNDMLAPAVATTTSVPVASAVASVWSTMPTSAVAAAAWAATVCLATAVMTSARAAFVNRAASIGRLLRLLLLLVLLQDQHLLLLFPETMRSVSWVHLMQLHWLHLVDALQLLHVLHVLHLLQLNLLKMLCMHVLLQRVQLMHQLRLELLHGLRLHEVRADLHRHVVGGLRGLAGGQRLHGQAASLPASKAPGQNANTLVRAGLLPVPIRALGRSVCRVLAREDHQRLICPFPYQVGHLVDKGH